MRKTIIENSLYYIAKQFNSIPNSGNLIYLYIYFHILWVVVFVSHTFCCASFAVVVHFMLRLHFLYTRSRHPLEAHKKRIKQLKVWQEYDKNCLQKLSTRDERAMLNCWQTLRRCWHWVALASATCRRRCDAAALQTVSSL